jgi:hypothetical protein
MQDKEEEGCRVVTGELASVMSSFIAKAMSYHPISYHLSLCRSVASVVSCVLCQQYQANKSVDTCMAS